MVEFGIERLNFSADALNVVLRELKLNSSNGNCKLMVIVDGVNVLFSPYTLLNKDHTTAFKGVKGGKEARGLSFGFRRVGQRPRRVTQEAREWMSNLARVDECSVLKNMKKLLKNDFSGAAVVASVDIMAMLRKQPNWNRSLFFTFELLITFELLTSAITSRWWSVRNRGMKPETDSHMPFALLGEEGWQTMDPFLPIEVQRTTVSVYSILTTAIYFVQFPHFAWFDLFSRLVGQ